MRAGGIATRQRVLARCAALALLLAAAADASAPRHQPAAAVGPHSARDAAREAPRSVGREGLGGRRLLQAGAANRWVDQVYVHGSGGGGAHKAVPVPLALNLNSEAAKPSDRESWVQARARAPRPVARLQRPCQSQCA
jgi:hypothetical protein